MQETNTLVIGASIAGLACAACLTKSNIDYIIIEKEDNIVHPWRNHYDRLHLHTSKKFSTLPYKEYDDATPTYPERLKVVEYMEEYQKEFKIRPYFNTRATIVKQESDYWIIETNKESFKAKRVIVATGPFGKAREVQFKGMDSFPGRITHSFGYKTGRNFSGQKVLVVGFGNSACEIAIDLHEQGASPSMSVRSAVNILPRDVLGIPVLQLGISTSWIPPKIADTINAPIVKLLLGNIEDTGLKKLPYGPIEQIHKYQKVPLLDIGTLKLIREGHINIHSDIDYIDGKTVHFVDGKKENFDAIVAAIGYEKGFADDLIKVDKSRFEDLKQSIDKQKYFGKDGLYFCGFWISPTGQIREISLDAQKIVNHITNQ